ncbi:hypothetical protein KI387_000063 [Taxus chinensis]|uniref:WW domain-containing protein n=1 Tax=Taxus chinensis TaxID=29808 RepID=A0AA38GU81_TAXCH|nr:hypothetical protein KI387_000063 [Taxus chinensis]
MSIISGLLQQKQSKIGWMVDAQLSLAPPSSLTSSPLSGIFIKKRRGSSTGDQMLKASAEESYCKKRKMDSDWDQDVQKPNSFNSSIGVELQMKTPLPLEWEQCLDLQSGRIYYVNRSTQLKTCQDPRVDGHGNLNQLSSKDLRLDLELNLPLKTHENEGKSFEPPNSDVNSVAFLEKENTMNDRAEMVATVCAQCHMFVMFSKASRKCPNCKYVHPLMEQDNKDSNDIAPARQTLSLINCGPESVIKSKQDDGGDE